MSKYNNVVLREELPDLSAKLLQIHVNYGYQAVDEYASSEDVCMEVSQLVDGKPVAWVPEKMLWKVVENEINS